MSKILNLVINDCCDCPYGRIYISGKKFFGCCNKKGMDMPKAGEERDSPLIKDEDIVIPEWCPLPGNELAPDSVPGVNVGHKEVDKNVPVFKPDILTE